jgi:hypothetical protein
VVHFDPSLNGQAIDLTSRELLVGQSINIVGPGANQLTVERSAADGTGAFRIFEIPANHHVSISGLTIRNGLLNADQDGLSIIRNALSGGIFNASGANLTVTNSLVTGNGAFSVNGYVDSTAMTNSLAEGGGIYNAGTATISFTTLSYNTAGGGWASYAGPGGGTAAGGGIYNAGTLTLTGCVFRGNTITSWADPLAYRGDSRGQGFGGGVYSNSGSSLSVSLAVLLDNQAFGASKVWTPDPWGGGSSGGGALYVGGTATVNDAEIESNYANFNTRTFTFGSALGGGVDVGPTANLTLDRVTLANNNAASDKSRGAGLFDQGTVVGTNVTISGNLVNFNPIPPSHGSNTYGGGVAVWDTGQLTLRFSTVVDNTALTYDPNGHPELVVAQGVGLFVGSSAAASLDSDVIALNQAGGVARAVRQPRTAATAGPGRVGDRLQCRLQPHWDHRREQRLAGDRPHRDARDPTRSHAL